MCVFTVKKETLLLRLSAFRNASDAKEMMELELFVANARLLSVFNLRDLPKSAMTVVNLDKFRARRPEVFETT